MSFYLDVIFCDTTSDIPQSNGNPEEQALGDKLATNPTPPTSNPHQSMVVDEETVAHLTQCMVCFGAEADVELINCGDQMCFACLEQYHVVYDVLIY